MNVNITTKKAQILNQEKSASTEKTVIETITIKDVHSLSDMEDAFEQIRGFSLRLFPDDEIVEHKVDNGGISFHVGNEDAWLKKWRDDVLNSMKPVIHYADGTVRFPCDVKMPLEHFPEPDPHDILANAKPQPSAQAEKFMDGLKEKEYDKLDSCFKAANAVFEAAQEIISAIKEVNQQSAPKPNFASGGFVSGVDGSKTGEIIPPRTASHKPEYAYKKSNCGYLYVKLLSGSSLAVEVLDVVERKIRSYSKPIKYYMPDGFFISVDEYMDKLYEVKTSGKKKKR